MHVRVGVLLTIGERESSGGPNVILSRQHLTPSWDERSEFSHFRPAGGNRSIFAVQLIAIRSSPTSKMILSVDSIDSCGQLRKFDDALYRMGLRVHRSATRDWPPFLACEPPPCHRVRILASSYSRHRLQRRPATGTIAFSSMESAPTVHFGLDSWRG
jgi:hypothetical protein